ncbi:MAG TPA: tetratricopeptide repeat protein [Pseudomonadota bacterium]|nr:tetratricopeptide repeat protein [Pseudomonadota bacterium]
MSETPERPAEPSETPATVSAKTPEKQVSQLPIVLDDLLELFAKELVETQDPQEHAGLAVRMALLLWDGQGKADAAVALLSDVHHPVASSLRLQAALSATGGDAGASLLPNPAVDFVVRHGSADDKNDLGELLLWRGEWEQAGGLLSEGSSPRLYALLLSSQGLYARAKDALAASEEAKDLLWAGWLHARSAKNGKQEGAPFLKPTTVRSFGVDVSSKVLQLRWSDAVLGAVPPYGPSSFPLLKERFALLGGEEGLGGSNPSLELVYSALELSTCATHAQVLEDPLTDVLVSAERAVHLHPTMASQLGAYVLERRAAEQLERAGRFQEAAQHFERQAERLLAELPPPASESGADEWTRAVALSLLYRAVDSWLLAIPNHGETARTKALEQATRLLGLGVVDEVLALRLSAELWQGSDRRAVCEWLWSCAQACPQAHPERLSLLVHAARAAEAMNVTGQTLLLPSSSLFAEQAPIPVLLTLARHFRRRGDVGPLLSLYRALSEPAGLRQPDGLAWASVCSSVAFLLAALLPQERWLEVGQKSGETSGKMREALTGLQELAEPHAEEPGGLVFWVARVLFFQRTAQEEPLLEALVALLHRVRNEKNKLRVLKQLAHHAMEAGDFSRAEASYQEVLERDPTDVVAMHALGRLLQQRGDIPQAMELLRTAVSAAVSQGGEASGQPSTMAMLTPHNLGLSQATVPLLAQGAALLSCELGALLEQQAAQTGQHALLEEALSVYEGALSRDARCRPAVRALVALYGTLGQKGRQLAAMRRLLPLLHDDEQRLRLLLDIGQLSEEQAAVLGKDAGVPLVEQSIDAYSEVLQIAPDHEAALSSLIHLCAQEHRYGLIAETLERAPKTKPFLLILADSYEKLGHPEGVAKTLRELWPLLDQPDEQIATLERLTELYKRLERAEDELDAWDRLCRLAPSHVLGQLQVVLQLEHRLGGAGRHAEQAELLSRAIAQAESDGAQKSAQVPEKTEKSDLVRQALLRLGHVLGELLQRPTEAMATFEKVLAKWPEEKTALASLASLYGQAGRQADQRRTLMLLLRYATGPAEKSRSMFQLGELCEKAGDVEEAYRLFGEAFFLDPANRGAFTAYERACYKRQKWPETLQIYETALRLIETQKTRSYRPADLHLRRGQVQLQYLQDVEAAIASYWKALESDAENDATQATLERIYGGLNQWKELLSVYERRAQLVRDDSKRVEILRRAARVATAKLRDVAEAVRFREKLLSVDPTDADSLDELERHYESSRDFEKLVALLSTRVTLTNDETQMMALHMRIGLLCEEGLRDHDRAISAYRHVVEAQPTHREALDAMARLLEANERWEELIEVTKRQIRLVTDRQHKALLFFKCGSVTEAKFNKEDEAIRYYEAAVRTSAACLPALHSLRDIYVRKEDYPHVTQTLELEAKLWTEPKEQAGILAHIGQIYLDKLKKPERAIEYYERALSVDKDCLPAHRALFHVYYERGDFYRTYQTGQVLLLRAAREGEPAERSAFHAKRAHAAAKIGELRVACESVALSLEIWPENLSALALLCSLCLQPNPGVDLFPTCRELERQFRRREQSQPLALLLCALSALAERASDSETAEAHLAEALRLLPEDPQVVEWVAGAYVRLARFEAAVALLHQFVERLRASGQASALPSLARAELLLAGLHSEVLVQPDAAIQLMRQCLATATRPEASAPPTLVYRARFLLAQELFQIGRYLDARMEMETLLQEVQPEGSSVVSPMILCRYFDYQGRVLEALGDMTAAQQSYLKAIDLDSTYAPPLLQLARWGVLTGNPDQAEALLRDAIERTAERTSFSHYDDRASEVLLRRGLARLLAHTNPQASVAEYERLGTLGADDFVQLPLCFDLESPAGPPLVWNGLSDRVALAEVLLHGVGDTTRAEQALTEVFRQDLRCAEAHALLVEVYEKRNETVRARRVRTVSAILGYLPAERRLQRSGGYRGTLTEELRQRLLLPAALRGSDVAELMLAMVPGLLRLFPPTWPWPSEPTPAFQVPDAGFVSAVSETLRLFALDVEVMVAHEVPGGAQALELLTGRRVALLDQSVLAMDDSERRFLLGRVLDPLRGGYATLLRLSPSEVLQTNRLFSMLLQPVSEQPSDAREFLQLLPRRSQQVFERVAQKRPTQAFSEVMAGFSVCADRAGLLAVDDLWTAVQLLAKLSGDDPTAFSPAGTPARAPDGAQPGDSRTERTDGRLAWVLSHAIGGAELFTYSLSEPFHELTQTLKEPSRL